MLEFVLFCIYLGVVVGIAKAIFKFSNTAAILLILGASIAFSATHSKASEIASSNLKDTALHLSVGSGSVVQGGSGRKYILTNFHVCHAMKWKGEIAGNFEGGRLLIGRVVKESPTSDLCAAVIREDSPALKFSSSMLLPLSKVTSRGYPMGILSESHGQVYDSIKWDYDASIEEEGECPEGTNKLYWLDGNLKACTFHFTSTLTSLYARPGSSGSPVVNEEGELVGVISSHHGDRVFEGGMVTQAQLIEFMKGL